MDTTCDYDVLRESTATAMAEFCQASKKLGMLLKQLPRKEQRSFMRDCVNEVVENYITKNLL